MFSQDEVELVKKDFWAVRDEISNLEEDINSEYAAGGISDMGYLNDLENRYSYLRDEVLPRLLDKLEEMGEKNP